MTTDTDMVEALAGEIRQRLDSLPTEERLAELVDERSAAALSDEALEQRVREMLPDLLADDTEGSAGDIIRKMKHGGAPELRGSKYEGLTVADVEWLHNVLDSAARSGLSKRGPSEDLRNAFDAISDGTYRTRAQADADDLARIEAFREDAERRGDTRAVRDAIAAVRAMDTQESGYGLQLIGAQYVGELWEAPSRLGRVFPLVNTFTMTDPVAYLPVEADLPELTYVQENVDHSKSGANEYDTVKSGSNRVTVTARKFVINQVWSGEMEEDSIIAFVPFLRGQAAKSVAHYSDSLVVNGDTTTAATGNINSNQDAPAATKHYLAFDGLRKAGLVDNTANAISVGGALTYQLFSDLRKLMVDDTYLHDWSHPIDPNDLVFLCDPATGENAGQLDEVLTVDKYGPQAIVLAGELARIGRNPLISTISISPAAADGYISSTPPPANDTGTIVAWNPNGTVAGWRRQVTVETDRMPRRDQSSITYSMRMGLGRFTPTGAPDGIQSIAVAHGITL